MRLLKNVRFGVALVTCLFVLACIAAPQMHGIILWDKIRRLDGFIRRDRIYRWCLWWADVEWRMFSLIMGITTDFRLPDVGVSPHPAVVIANHRSSIDTLLLPIVLRRMGYRKITAVVKQEVSGFPVIGTVAREIRAAFVARNHDPKDLERVRECAEQARDDGACVMIFPEGTVLACGRSRGDYNEVLVPKTGGLGIIREVLPHWPVLSVTIDWCGITGAVSIYSAWTMVGGHIEIDGRFLEDAGSLPLEEWLTAEWDRKERALADASAGRLLRKIRRIRAGRNGDARR